MKERHLDQAAREIAKVVVAVMPYLNEHKISAQLYGYFSGEVALAQASFDDAQFYFTEDLKEILERSFDDASPEDEDALIASSDIRWAFGMLSDSYQYRILERYKHGVVRPHDSPERAQLNRAVAKMCDILNGWNRQAGFEGPGSRKVWSNARATAELDADYSGDRDSWTNPWGWRY